MKKILLGLFLVCGFISKAQIYNNEWIDYTKTYYKFKVGSNGVYHIPQSVLASAGLASTPAEFFQLWRNGVQIPIYTSIPSGTLSNTDYIEFWGEMNDGNPDKELYRDPSYQLNAKWSLETDTAAYFLTINQNISNNLRLQNTANNVAGNTLPAEPYFIYTIGKYFNDQINPGNAVNVGDYMYSSSYDKGEGMTSINIALNGSLSYSFPDPLNVYTSGPSPKFKIAVAGNAINARRYNVTINSDSVIGNEVDFFNFSVDSSTFNLSTLTSNSATVNVTNLTQCITPPDCPTYDALVVAQYEITYPRKFDFGGKTNFEFYLPANASGNFLQITNFSYGSTIPVLYDLTNGMRYAADLSTAPLLQFVLQPSALDRRMILVSEDPSLITNIASLQTRNFINYTAAPNQGDYLIISNPILYNGGNGSNPVDEYRQYRSSAAGGGFNAKVYDANEIEDQFGFGIKKSSAAMRDFIHYARTKYAVSPKNIFIIGKGVNYMHARWYESNPQFLALNIVPSFGWPSSDVLLTADQGSSYPTVPIGRLSAISAAEVALYLKKVKDYEQAQVTSSPYIQDKAWMKNVVHMVGTSDGLLKSLLDEYMNNYKQVIIDTAFGADVITFSKNSVSDIEQINSTLLQNLFTEGLSLITYFGHSSSTTLEFNLDNPANYNNFGKYPMFVGLGCNAGNFFNFNLTRLQTKETISERYVLEPDRGTIGFIASTHFGIVHYLDIWNSRFYNELSNTSYGKTIGEQMKAAAEDVFGFTSQDDFYARCNVEETELHGDPAVKLNSFKKPDYVIEDSMLKITPGFISVGDRTFKVQASFINIGKAVSKNIVVEVKRTYPNKTVAVIARDTIPGIRYMDSVTFNIPINPLRDKGINKITVTVDADNAVDELYETNNSVSRDIIIYEDEATPVYPYNYAIVNKQNIKLVASTANPFSAIKQYKLEFDTTALFNSPYKVSKTLSAPGGILEFDPGKTFTDNTVYYWRVAKDTTATLNWNVSSFIYLANSDPGYNQSHYFQHLDSDPNKIILNNSRTWVFDSITNNLFIKNGVFFTATNQEGDLTVSVNGAAYIRSACIGYSLIFNVFDQRSFKSIYSWGPNCAPGRQFNTEYSYASAASRKQIMDFMDSIPAGSYVVVRNILNNYQTSAFINDWIADTAIYGSNNDLYHKLKAAGMANLDSFTTPRAFGFIYQKGGSFKPVYNISQGMYDIMTLSADIKTPDTIGTVTSPIFGPAITWKQFKWAGNSSESPSNDEASVDIIGIKSNGLPDTLFSNVSLSQPIIDISSINATQYPYLQLHMNTKDTAGYTPYQLNYWRITYVPAPEGAVAPNLYFQMKDTVDLGEPVEMQLAFKNISEENFDSLKVKIIITDRNNVQHILPTFKQRPLLAGDTLHIRFPMDTKQYAGANNIYVEVNPDNDQPEQYHLNNFIFKLLYVRPDTLHPFMDVTFDNVHILNHDIVSAKPNIVVNLKDEAKWMMLSDPSVLKVQVRFPDNTLHPYNFDNDTLQFIPAQTPVKDGPSSVNTAQAIFKPYFTQDGEYELIITGQDMSQNNAGNIEYRVTFDVINKPMISNMLNYPNPFTTSTAFVFTVTGSEVPQNIKIQVLTITGKVVREITKDELGPLHIGRNITEFKWDGTDQYGQKLANGVYLYHVVTNLNGKALDKYTSDTDNTDKYFIKGYGKMYLMR